MNTKKQKHKINRKKTCYCKLPTRINQKDFNMYIKPYLSKRFKGPRGRISFYKIFNYILYVLHTDCQWKELITYRNEIHWSNIYKWHSRWSKDGSYQTLFEASVSHLSDWGKLDLSILHGDVSNVVAKKGVMS